MRILYFTKYSSLGASSRLRSIQYFHLLETNGFEVLHFPLFSDKYLRLVYKGKKTRFLFLFFSYMRRFFHLWAIRKKDILFIEKELFPYIPAWFEMALNRLGFKYYVDYDDAIFHNYDLNPNKIIRRILQHKIDIVMKNSKCVFAGNEYLAERARKSGAKRIQKLPTVIDTEKYYKIKASNNPNFILGWVGSPSTFK